MSYDRRCRFFNRKGDFFSKTMTAVNKSLITNR